MTEGPSGKVNLCREYALPHNDLRSRARGWIRKNTKFGQFDRHVCYHGDRYSIEIQVQSLIQDRTASSVNETETLEDEEHGDLSDVESTQ